MLHILWILIKFILILLGILLGLVLLAVLLLLFCPVRYRASATKEGTSFREAEIEARVSWLFRVIGVRFFFRNGEQKLTITLFGISLDKIRGWLAAPRKRRKAQERHRRQIQKQGGSGEKSADSKRAAANSRKDTSKPEDTDRPENTDRPEDTGRPENTDKPENTDRLENTDKPEDTGKPKEQTCFEPEKPLEKLVEGKENQARESELPQEKITEPEAGEGRLGVWFARIRDILIRMIGFPGVVWKKITSFMKGIRAKLRQIRETIAKIRGKLDWWKGFLGNERTKAAISLVWKDAKGLICHILPIKVEGQVTFGCDDPSITGTVLAVLGMTFPFHQNRIQVTPLFDGENQLTGNISLKGRIYGIVLVKAAIEIYINKNVKYVINRWKHKEEP